MRCLCKPLSILLLSSCLAEKDQERQTKPHVLSNSQIAINNLNSHIAGLQARFAQTASIETAESLIEELLSRAHFLGTYSDFDEIVSIVGQLNDSVGSKQIKARVLASFHRFDEALALTTNNIAKENIDLARGQNLNSMLETRMVRAEKSNTASGWIDVAVVVASLGQFELADRYFVLAEKSYRNISPFFLAYLYFQRGLMWSEQANLPTKGGKYYEIAVNIMPQYIVANIHLAEIEHQRGEQHTAIKRLKQLLNSTEDPEVYSRLAEYIADPNERQVYAQQAKQMYDGLLLRFPLAFLDHASEFYAGPGSDETYALELALRNLNNRKNHRAYIVAIKAACLTADTNALKKLRAQAHHLEGGNVNLDILLQTCRE